MPPSKIRWSVHVAPWSSDHATQTVLNVFSWVALHPVAAFVATLPPSHATYTRPACGPDCTTLMPPGIVSQNDAASASGELITSFGAPKVFPPSVDTFTQIWFGPQSW